MWCIRGGGTPGMGRRSRWFRVGSQVGRGQSPHGLTLAALLRVTLRTCVIRELLWFKKSFEECPDPWPRGGIIRGGGGAALQGVPGSDEPAKAE